MSNKKSKLNLNTDKENPPVMTPEQATVQFYNTLTNCIIDMSISLHKQSEIHNEILIELTDIKDNFNRMGLKQEWITELDIAEREKEIEPDGDAKETS